MATGKRVIVTGATGLIGREVCKGLIARGYDVVVFSRNPDSARTKVPGAADYISWTPAESGPWAAQLDGAWGVISLAGASIAGKRWNDDYKRQIRDTRVVGTRGLIKAMAAAQEKPKVFVSGSAVGYYGARDATPLDESANAGSDFLAGVVQ
ncbi:MAG: SDR family NAD(P)-dependent oxidoreductase, partial [Nostocoides sp.]